MTQTERRARDFLKLYAELEAIAGSAASIGTQAEIIFGTGESLFARMDGCHEIECVLTGDTEADLRAVIDAAGKTAAEVKLVIEALEKAKLETAAESPAEVAPAPGPAAADEPTSWTKLAGYGAVAMLVAIAALRALAAFGVQQ